MEFHDTRDGRGIERGRIHVFRFRNVAIDAVFASPYDRTVETAAGLLKERNAALVESGKPPIKINLELGIIEVSEEKRRF